MLDSAFLQSATATELQAQLSAGEITSIELVDAYLAQIEKHDGYLHAVISKAPRENVRALAKQLDEERAAGSVRSLLHGIPVLVKDNIATHPDLGMDTTAGSKALASSRPRKNADVVQRLLDSGAIIIAKANLSEFSWFKTSTAPAGWSPAGGQTQSAYVRGGFQKDDSSAGHSSAGGSSSGPAVGVSAGYAPISIGTETQGSLILPANRAALYALKPTIGLVPIAGIVPISKLCDSAGPLTKSAADLANLLDILVDPTKTKIPEGGYQTALTGIWDGLKIAALDPAAWVFSEKTRKRAPGADEQMVSEARAAYAKLRDLASAFHEDVDLLPVERFKFEDKFILGQIFDATFKEELEAYLRDLEYSQVRSLEEVIQFNKDHADVELPESIPGQEFLESALQNAKPESEISGLVQLLRQLGGPDGLDKVFATYDTNILIGPVESNMALFAAAAGYPIASLPLGYLSFNGRPHGLAAIAPAHHESLLIQLMSAWEATFPPRQPPALE